MAVVENEAGAVKPDDDELLERYATKFANLNSQTGAEWWPEGTLNRAPHKPLLLLSVLDLIASGNIQTNRIDLDDALRERFRTYWSLVMPPDKRPNPAVPFKYMAGESFWHLDAAEAALQTVENLEDGEDEETDETHAIGPAATLDPELFALLEKADARRRLRERLVTAYFVPDTQTTLLAAASQADGGSGIRYWWVNGAQPEALDGDLGLLWSARQSRSGGTIRSWRNLLELRPGDCLVHYGVHEQQIVGISVVLEGATSANDPAHRPQMVDVPGDEVRVRYESLPSPIPRLEVPNEFRQLVSTPLASDGSVRRGYIFPLTPDFVRTLVDTFPDRWPPLLTAPTFSAQSPTRATSFWWVNQGTSYKQDKEGAYLWAPKTGKNNATFGHWTNVSKVRPGDVIFHYANNQILATSSVQELPSEQPHPTELAENASEQDGYLARVSPYQELDPPIRRADIPLDWRTEDKAGPFSQDGSVKQGLLFPLNLDFVRKLAGRFPQLGSVPNLPVTKGAVWLFQANPNFYNLADELQHMAVGSEDSWSVTRYRDRIQSGDILLLWQGGKDAGIYATAELTSGPFQRDAVGDWMVKRDGADAKPDLGVHYRLTRILNPPIPKAVLQQHPILKNLMVIRAPTGTNFAVTEQEWSAIQELMGEPVAPPPDYVEPDFSEIVAAIRTKGLRFSERTLRRYHLSLKTHGFVILSGISGGGKTQLARAYAEAVGANHLVVSVAPNWNTNEDLLGFFNPVHRLYVDTPFSHFLRRAAREHQQAGEAGRTPRPFHVILDEMNLARVEHYFASFLSAMELRASGEAEIELAPGELVDLTANLAFVGTVNVDETTHSFADKVYDRAQLVEIDVPRELIVEHLADTEYQELLLEIWDRLLDVAPFAFRVLNDINAYVVSGTGLGATWQESLDDQLLQKILPKLGGADDKVGPALDWMAARTAAEFPLTHAKAAAMAVRCHAFGFASYF